MDGKNTIFERYVEVGEQQCSLMQEFQTEEDQITKPSSPDGKVRISFDRIRRMGFKDVLRIVLAVLMIACIATFLGLLIGSDEIQTFFSYILEWIEGLPTYLSGGLISLMYALALLVFCPGTPFNLASGFLFGIWGGFAVAITGCVIGATLAFILGRTIAKEWITNKIQGNQRLVPIFFALKKNGLYLVLLTRLSPLFPFPLLNYAFGIAPVETSQYIAGTLLGSAPSTFAYCYLGTLMRDLTDMWSSESTSDSTIWLMSIGGTVSVLSIVIISLITHRAIKKATQEYAALQSTVELDLVVIKTDTSKQVENVPQMEKPSFVH
eukprot:TRINITY_DN21585_c0_g1_i1.p1 TRINITY_DN21585_c0_g1~~TRINITY_DN21585_c0_g1_i1.p1  ORF type:complete len:323 (+),score=93.78 TRINITY_DN21585_c0_g1_i1:69-1037(+)